jgi:Lamin Tail Domain/Secretion system C-terminal sorting domain
MKKILLFGCTLMSALFSNAQNQNCGDVFISEYVEGTNNNKAIELYNASSSAIDLGAGQYKMGRARDGAAAPMLIGLTGVLPPYGVRVFALDKRDPNGTGNEIPLDSVLMAAADTFLNPVYVQTDSPMYFNGDDAFVFGKGADLLNFTILDIIGKVGEDPGSGWFVPGDPFSAWWTTDNTLIRKSTILHGVTTNPITFDPSMEWDSLPANTFDQLGTHLCDCGVISVNENKSYSSFTLFPNPISEGKFVLKGSQEMFSVRIIGLDGQLVFSQQFDNATRNSNVVLPKAESGMYVVEVLFKDGTKRYSKILSR